MDWASVIFLQRGLNHGLNCCECI